ncbi:hypothetical protein CDD82_5760 [Ophiocordyceps australis]|uniref:TLC domain-containing protein n=1 Tax=Ophiocordyceps australis TaxID=1399860 RepID=A0A2C5ZR75_9HYPO|nr:hypothetical protein CDD82_5760 [Ophiocordyceps australis]
MVGFRAAATQYAYGPLARRLGIVKAKDVPRFTEQAWLMTYSCTSLPVGSYIYLTSSYAFSMRHLWMDWPWRGVDGLTKRYMLAQLAFWLAQILVMHIEERRKDYGQMVAHHVITIALVGGAYAYHLYPVGNLILVLMDISDFFLPLAKCLRYTGKQALCDVVFCFFLVSWILTRHVMFLRVCWSLWVDAPRVMRGQCFVGGIDTGLRGPFEPPRDGSWGYIFEPFFNARGIVCFSPEIRGIFLAGLLGLQVLIVMWFVMIVRIAKRVIAGSMAEDLRSDDEGGDHGGGEGEME